MTAEIRQRRLKRETASWEHSALAKTYDFQLSSTEVNHATATVNSAKHGPVAISLIIPRDYPFRIPRIFCRTAGIEHPLLHFETRFFDANVLSELWNLQQGMVHLVHRLAHLLDDKQG